MLEAGLEEREEMQDVGARPAWQRRKHQAVSRADSDEAEALQRNQTSCCIQSKATSSLTPQTPFAGWCRHPDIAAVEDDVVAAVGTAVAAVAAAAVAVAAVVAAVVVAAAVAAAVDDDGDAAVASVATAVAVAAVVAAVLAGAAIAVAAFAAAAAAAPVVVAAAAAVDAVARAVPIAAHIQRSTKP